MKTATSWHLQKAVATDTFLTDEEIQELTERKVRPAQVRVLRSMGIQHRVRPDGSVVILRAHIHKVFDGDTNTRIKQIVVQPNWDVMPRKRSIENKDLPARWKHEHDLYFYRLPPGLESQWDGKKTFNLGTNLGEAYRVWSDRINKPTEAKTISELLARYAL